MVFTLARPVGSDSPFVRCGVASAGRDRRPGCSETGEPA
ncbi:hypothetical protein BDD21_5331 [Thiocapsa rosea]|uniref:Uncharacterized protein n=1 Tax=Thiocapsa rosea TaxID=69360 RepID=A0A495VEB5_9GAMM|nr:hypothetical protein BDD21_5331 [Thiocapsa rosea]